MKPFLRGMAVPRMTQLRPGVAVNIVLKADQPTGKLTTGQVSDILTRGDHPRGIKVRLSDGKIGRVQSLAPSSRTDGSTAPADDDKAVLDAGAQGHSKRPFTGRVWRPQQDYRTEEPQEPQNESSLLDYVRVKPSRKSKARVTDGNENAVPLQQQLESEFPKLDSTLIAAILLDHEKVEEARKVLASLG